MLWLRAVMPGDHPSGGILIVSGCEMAPPAARIARIADSEFVAAKTFCAIEREWLSTCRSSPTQDRMCSRLCASP